MIRSLLILYLAHWIGDFVLQSDWMARNKSKNMAALSLHVLGYTATLAMFSLWIALPSAAWFIFVVLNGSIHFCVDFITSRITARLYAKGDIHNFFVVVGFDQMLHAATLLLTLSIIAP